MCIRYQWIKYNTVYFLITYTKSRIIPYIYILFILILLYEKKTHTSKPIISIIEKCYRSTLLNEYNSRPPSAAAHMP